MADDETQDSSPTDKPATGEDALGDAGKQALDRMKAERDEARRQAKANADAAKRLAQIEEANKTETEKLVEAARREGEANGRKAVSAEYGERLARETFLAAAARRNAEHDAATILDDLNLGRFVSDDGEPNSKEIAAAVERLIPAPAADPRPKGDVGLGPRTAPPAPTDGSPRSLIAAGIAASDATKR